MVARRHAPRISTRFASLIMFSSTQSTRRSGVSKGVGERLDELYTRQKSLSDQRAGAAYAPKAGILLHCGM